MKSWNERISALRKKASGVTKEGDAVTEKTSSLAEQAPPSITPFEEKEFKESTNQLRRTDTTESLASKPLSVPSATDRSLRNVDISTINNLKDHIQTQFDFDTEAPVTAAMDAILQGGLYSSSESVKRTQETIFAISGSLDRTMSTLASVSERADELTGQTNEVSEEIANISSDFSTLENQPFPFVTRMVFFLVNFLSVILSVIGGARNRTKTVYGKIFHRKSKVIDYSDS